MEGTKNSKVTIFVGIDVHLKQWNVAINIENRHFKTFQQEPKAETLSNYLARNFPGAVYKSVYEAGFCGLKAHRELCSYNIENIVINPADVPTMDRERKRKSDKVDAKKLARSLYNGELNGNFIPSEQQEADRSLVRFRICQSRKALTAIKQQLKSFLILKGIDYTELGVNDNWSLKFIELLKAIKFDHQGDQFVFNALLDKFDFIRTKQKQVDKQLVIHSKTDRFKDLVDRLRSIPGVGLLTSMVLATELIEIKRFRNLDSLCSFMGIVPDVEGSDQTVRVKGLTKRVNNEVRRILIQSAWIAAGRAPDIALAYQKWRMNNGNNGPKAIIKVAKKLLSIVRTIWANEIYYEPQLG